MADNYDSSVEGEKYLRYREARRAGLTIVEARLFQDSEAKLDELRKLVAGECPVELIRKIVL